MLSRSISLGYMLCIFFGVLQSFVALHAFDEIGIVGPRSQILVTEAKSDLSGQQVKTVIESFSAETGVDIAKPVSNFTDPNGVQPLYVAVGDSVGMAAQWLAAGRYPDFGADRITAVHPMSEWQPENYAGYYWVFGTHADADRLLGELGSIGLDGVSAQYPGLEGIPMYISHTALVPTALLSVLLVVALVGAGVGANVRNYGVQRLHGSSASAIWRRDVVQMGRRLVATLLVVIISAALSLWLFNRFRQIDHLLTIAVVVVGSLLAVACLTHVAALAVLHRSPIAVGLAGDVSIPYAFGAMYAVRLSATLMSVFLTVTAIHGTAELRTQQEGKQSFSELGAASFLYVNGGVVDNRAELDARLGDLIRKSDQEGGVVLSLQVPGAEMNIGTTLSDGGDVLVVNETYLEHQEVRDAKGHRIGATADDVVRVYVPSGEGRPPAEVRQNAAEWIRFQGSGTADSEGPIQVLALGADQRIFTYGGKAEQRLPLWHRGMIIVLPSMSEQLSNDNLVAFATSGQIIFLDPHAVIRQVRDSGLTTYVGALETVNEAAQAQHQALLAEQRHRLLNLVGAFAVLVMSAFGLSLVYGRRFARALFVKHVHGWSSFASNRWPLVAEALLAVVVVGWTTLQTLQTLALRDSLEAPPSQTVLLLDGAEPLVALAVTVTGCAVAAGALVVTHQRIIRSSSANS